jgi:hypothetical protein
MTKDEALKLALEALENIKNDPFKFDLKNGIDKAITTIKEALAQPEQERFLVATIGNWGRVEWADGVFPSLGDKMYSAPRTWVGLTEQEQGAIMEDLNAYGTNLYQFARAIEAKLKEKNT